VTAGRTVLVVDDDDEVREITKLSLEIMGGWEVTSADRGAKALKLAAEHLPHVILLDVMMPEMDGPTTFRHLQADPATCDIPVILLTAKVRVGHSQVWDDLPVAGVISKPFNPTTLTEQIDELVSQWRSSASVRLHPAHAEKAVPESAENKLSA
jgi:CheY-like chemotaxis protein